MSRIIDLTVTLKLEVADHIGRSEFRHNLERMIRDGLDDVLTPYAGGVRIVAVTDPKGVLSQPVDLGVILDSRREAAIVWSAEDVLDVRPDLSLEQASEVLHHVIRQHDANHGIGWQDFEYFAENLFGTAPHEQRSGDLVA
jgi:hypothetical protein